MTNAEDTTPIDVRPATYRAIVRETGAEIPARSLQECVGGVENALGLTPGAAVTVGDGSDRWRVYASQALADLDAPSLEPSSWCARIAAEADPAE